MSYIQMEKRSPGKRGKYFLRAIILGAKQIAY
jgi:hypothetical protein